MKSPLKTPLLHRLLSIGLAACVTFSLLLSVDFLATMDVPIGTLSASGQGPRA